MILTEPDVALSDYGLALECALFAYAFTKAKSKNLKSFQNYAFLLFASIGLSALFGGTVHGFFNEPSAGWHDPLWLATLLCIGFSGFAFWNLGGCFYSSPSKAAYVFKGSLGLLLIFTLLVLSGFTPFWLSLLYYLPSTLFLLGHFIQANKKGASSSKALKVGISALLLTFIASGVQFFQISPFPQYFNHNTFYHLLMAIALLGLYYALSHLNRDKAI